MKEFIIQGPTKLVGEVQIGGSKNAALPIIAATILAKGEFVIENVPEITDIFAMLEILEGLGATYTLENNVCRIDTTNVSSFKPDPKKVRNNRGSILLTGSLLARFNEVVIAHPGGCFIGARPIVAHLNGLEMLGAKVRYNDDNYHLKSEGLNGTRIVIDFFSVTATETLVMAAALAAGTTELRLAATEPHVVDLCNFLVRMGAKISGIGTHNLTIEGVKELKPTTYSIIPDQIEAGTFAIAAAVSRGEVTINGFVEEHHELFLKKLAEAGVNFELLDNNRLKVKRTSSFNPVEIRTNIFPGFPTDLQSPFALLLTQAEGSSEIYETIYESRLNYINELNKMGANGIIRNAHEATITGPTPLYGTTITSLDLRAGATLIIAALVANGESCIENIELIDRGYEKIEEKLRKLGANIERVETEEVTS